MAKKVKELRVDFIKEEIERETAILTGLREEYRRISHSITTTVDKLKKLEEQLAKQVPPSLAEIFETYTDTGENVVGHNILKERAWHGDWRNSGLTYSGSYWSENNQRALDISIKPSYDDAKLEKLVELIEEVLPAMKTGAAVRGNITLEDDEVVELSDLKLFDIKDEGLSEHHNWVLGAMPDGRWVIYDAYTARYNWSRHQQAGTLLECLKEIRKRYHNGY